MFATDPTCTLAFSGFASWRPPFRLSRLWPVIASAYGLQLGMCKIVLLCCSSGVLNVALFLALACVFVPQANEKWYDLGGAMGFLSTTLVSLYYPALKTRFHGNVSHVAFPKITDFAPRQLVGSILLSMWSIRLGTFLVNVRHTKSLNRTRLTREP